MVCARRPRLQGLQSMKGVAGHGHRPCPPGMVCPPGVPMGVPARGLSQLEMQAQFYAAFRRQSYGQCKHMSPCPASTIHAAARGQCFQTVQGPSLEVVGCWPPVPRAAPRVHTPRGVRCSLKGPARRAPLPVGMWNGLGCAFEPLRGRLSVGAAGAVDDQADQWEKVTARVEAALRQVAAFNCLPSETCAFAFSAPESLGKPPSRSTIAEPPRSHAPPTISSIPEYVTRRSVPWIS